MEMYELLDSSTYLVVCTYSGQGFRYGTIYAMAGWNNGHYVIRTGERGDVITYQVSDCGDLLNPLDDNTPTFRYLNPKLLNLNINIKKEILATAIIEHCTSIEEMYKYDIANNR